MDEMDYRELKEKLNSQERELEALWNAVHELEEVEAIDVKRTDTLEEQLAEMEGRVEELEILTGPFTVTDVKIKVKGGDDG